MEFTGWVIIIMMLYVLITIPIVCDAIINYIDKKELEKSKRQEEERQIKDDIIELKVDVRHMKMAIEDIKIEKRVVDPRQFRKDFTHLFEDDE